MSASIAATHKHEFGALWWNFGRYGRQDVHVHSCMTGDGCDWVVVGPGRDCAKGVKHEAERREGGRGWKKDYLRGYQ